MAVNATKEKPSLTITRNYPAGQEEVWRALTEANLLKQWLAPSDAYLMPVAEADVRVGGRYRFVMKPPEGEEHEVSGVYREVVPNKKLVFTWAWKSSPEHESLVTISLRPAGRGTGLMLKHEQFVDADARDRHEQGWTGSLGRLERCLA